MARVETADRLSLDAVIEVDQVGLALGTKAAEEKRGCRS